MVSASNVPAAPLQQRSPPEPGRRPAGTAPPAIGRGTGAAVPAYVYRLGDGRHATRGAVARNGKIMERKNASTPENTYTSRGPELVSKPLFFQPYRARLFTPPHLRLRTRLPNSFAHSTRPIRLQTFPLVRTLNRCFPVTTPTAATTTATTTITTTTATITTTTPVPNRATASP